MASLIIFFSLLLTLSVALHHNAAVFLLLVSLCVTASFLSRLSSKSTRQLLGLLFAGLSVAAAALMHTPAPAVILFVVSGFFIGAVSFLSYTISAAKASPELTVFVPPRSESETDHLSQTERTLSHTALASLDKLRNLSVGNEILTLSGRCLRVTAPPSGDEISLNHIKIRISSEIYRGLLAIVEVDHILPPEDHLVEPPAPAPEVADPPVSVADLAVNISDPTVNGSDPPVNDDDPPVNVASDPPVNVADLTVNASDPPVNVADPTVNASDPPVNFVDQLVDVVDPPKPFIKPYPRSNMKSLKNPPPISITERSFAAAARSALPPPQKTYRSDKLRPYT